jgi:hypothetical protein
MKVFELLKALENEDLDAEVHFSYDYGDHSHTAVAPKVRHVEAMPVIYSEYHQMPRIVDEDHKYRETGGEMVVILFS